MGEQVKQERVRRSRRNQDNGQSVVQTDGQTYEELQNRLNEVDEIITDIVTPSTSETSVVMGEQDRHEVRPIITNEELVNSFRQQSGE